MVALVQAELEIDRLAVQGYVWIFSAWKLLDTYLPLSEIGVYFVFLAEACLYFIQERVVEVPEVLVLDRDGVIISRDENAETSMSSVDSGRWKLVIRQSVILNLYPG